MSEETTHTTKNSKSRIAGKTVLWSAAVLLFVLSLMVISIQIPYFQTRIVGKLTQIVTEKTGFASSIRSVNIKWFDTIVLDSVTVLDENQEVMIFVDQVAIDFDIRTLINGREIYLDEAHLQKGAVNLIVDDQYRTLNITRFIDNVRGIFKKKTKKKSKEPPIFTIADVHLRDVDFSYYDHTKEQITEGFDYYHFDLNDITGDAEDLRVVADTLELMVNTLKGHEPVHNFKVHDFIGFYRYTDQSMSFLNFDFYAGNSTLRDSVVFHYDDKRDLGFFNDSVRIVAKIDQTELHSADLAIFSPFMSSYEEYYTLSGNFDGKVSNFTIYDFMLDFGSRSHLAGDVSFDGLPNFKESFIDLDLRSSFVDVHDLRQYINKEDAYQSALKFGEVKLNGNFLGFPSDFVANADFDTQLGTIRSDINLKLAEQAEYSGSLMLRDFNLAPFNPRPGLFQKTSLQGTIRGSGLTEATADFRLDAHFKYLGVNSYRYKNITTNAHFARSFFEGQLQVNDPNLKLKLDGTVDLREQLEEIAINAQLDTAFLKTLKLSDEDIFVRTRLNTNTRSLELDKLTGTAAFHDLFVRYRDRNLAVDSLQLVSRLEDSLRFFSLQSDLMQATASGNYDFSQLYKDMDQLLKEYQLIFSNDAETLAAFYENKPYKSVQEFKDKRYELDYDFRLYNINPLLQLLAPELRVSYNTVLEGNFNSGYTKRLSLHSQIDSVHYQNSLFLDNNIDISTSKITDSTDVLAMFFLSSERQELDQDDLNLQTKNLVFEAIWDNDHIDFLQKIEQVNTENHANVSGELRFLKDSTEITLAPSDLQALNRKWYFSEGNRIILTGKEVISEQLALYNQSEDSIRQEISASGALSSDPEKAMMLKVSNFQVENLNPLLSREYQGEVNGFIDLRNVFRSSEDSLTELDLDSEFSVKDFSIGNFKVGNILTLAGWDSQRKSVDIDMMVNRKGQRIISLKGDYLPGQEKQQLDMKAFFQDANINILEPFFDEYFTNFAGKADGNFSITGSLDAPVLTGQGLIQGGGIRINYLNTYYTFDGGIFFEENTIGVKELQLRDNRKNLAVFNGGFFHDGFKNFVIDLEGELNNVAVLNTTFGDNDMFYGKGFASGSVNLLGAIENMDISAKIKTERGTKIYIPIESVGSAEQSEYISFVDFSDSTLTDELNEKVKLTGLNLDLEIEITPDAYGELIFDARTGDIIRGRGTGQLQMLISSAGDFNMFGDIAFQEGGYNFTLYNIINKEFQIQPGSSILWLGDPYGGIMDIKATYQQLASLAPLVPDPTARETDDEVRRRYPAEVLMELTGDLMSPDIKFAIDVEEYPENNFLLQAAVEALRNVKAFGEEELNRQVFSLIVLRRFSEIGSFEGGGNAVSSSVSELLSNQFSYWLSQVDENLEIDLDLGSLDEDRFNTFQLRLSYTFLEGRLRVTRDGGFTNLNNQANTASIIGDVMVEYLLTQNGKFRVKVYNRNNFNSILQGVGVASNSVQGISLVHIESFDKVKELFAEARRKSPLQEQKEPAVEQVQDTIKMISPSQLDSLPQLKMEETAIKEF
ncbi:MAG: translocation/assembly module TamB domain-containing protein [Cyclobacteriaceae bacterium]